MKWILMLLASWFFTVAVWANDCDAIKVKVDNQSDTELQLQAGSTLFKVSIPPKTTEIVSVSLLSYRDKVCSVIEIKVSDNDALARYIVAFKHPQIAISIDKDQKLSVTGLNGPLPY